LRQGIVKFIPAASWLGSYNRLSLQADLIAALVVTVMLIPQSLAYAMLAGLPPEVGLYASMLPLLFYALLGTSSTLSVGPVAITSLLTASALAQVAESGSADYLSAAITLAAMSGLFLLAFGLVGLGFLANFLSHAVVSAFISASAIIIACSQLRHLFGIEGSGDTLYEIGHGLAGSIGQTNGVTLSLGLTVLSFLYLVKRFGKEILVQAGLSANNAGLAAKTAPVLGVILTISAVWYWNLDALDVDIVGEVPRGIPGLQIPAFPLQLVQQLWVPALLISIIGYVESISVGRTLGALRRERVNENQELISLGAANLASACSGAFPVTGGFSRSVVNFDAGAATQAASIYTAVFIALATLFLTPALYYLPSATLAATIIIAVLALADFSIFRKTWRFAKSDFIAVSFTFLLTLALGVEVGVSTGVLVSLALHLHKTSRPHIAEVGQIEGTEHFRNIKRYKVSTVPEILSLRIDESLFFANANYLERKVFEKVFADDRIAHVVLLFNAINEVDYSALEVMEELNERLYEQGITLHISEMKGPVFDRLSKVEFLDHLHGNYYLSHFQAISDLCQRYGYQPQSGSDGGEAEHGT
jgi:SulP family sulfate permease